MIYLMDTDTAIMLMRGLSIATPRTEKQRARQATGRRILGVCRSRTNAGDSVGLSAITIAELEYGACRADDPDAERERMSRFLAPFLRLDFSAEQPTRSYGIVRSSLESAGQTIDPNDLLIAAHALAVGATLVSNNLVVKISRSCIF
jgi:tRNA(fMet)-specific endonuclease VapC